MANESTFNTKYGAVSVSTDASSNITTLDLSYDKTINTVKAEFNPDGSIKASSVQDFASTIKATPIKGNTFGIKLTSTGSIETSSSDLTANTVEIDDDPTNTYGLASKIYVNSKVNAHASDSDAHKTLFNNILKQITDLYEEKGELHAFKISDNYGNVINANGKCIWDGDTEHPKYLVFSSEKNPDIDSKFTALSGKMDELSGSLDDKQNALTVGTDLNLTDAGYLTVTDMRYNDTALRNRTSLIETKMINHETRISDIESKESTWSGKQDKINSPSDIGAQAAGNYVTTSGSLKILVVDEEPEVKEENTLYFVKE